MLWFWLALFTSVMWGIGYAISGKYVKEISPSLVLIIIYTIGLAAFTIVFFVKENVAEQIEQIKKPEIYKPMIIVALAFLIGNLSIYEAIRLKNASMVNLIEISYPIFTILAAWFLYKEVQVSVPVALGGVLIMSGIVTIYLFSK